MPAGKPSCILLRRESPLVWVCSPFVFPLLYCIFLGLLISSRSLCCVLCKASCSRELVLLQLQAVTGLLLASLWCMVSTRLLQAVPWKGTGALAEEPLHGRFLRIKAAPLKRLLEGLNPKHAKVCTKEWKQLRGKAEQRRFPLRGCKQMLPTASIWPDVLSRGDPLLFGCRF